MEPVTLAVISMLGSAASIISLYNDWKAGRVNVIDDAAIEKYANRTVEILSKDKDFVSVVAKSAGDPVFSALMERIDLRRKRAALLISSGDDPSDAVNDMNSELSEMFGALRRSNGGVLPPVAEAEFSKLEE